MGASGSVDNELARMKAELSGGSAPKELPSGPVSDAVPGGSTSFPVQQPAAGEGQ
jgi:hypothetical protein